MNPDDFPSDWEMIKLSNLLLEGARNGVYKPKEYHGSGVKIVNMGELFAYPRLRSPPMKRVRISDDEIKRFTLKKNDLLFARRSLVAEGAGKCSIVLSVNELTTFESSIIRLRPDPDKVDSEFLFYLFDSPQGKYLLDTILRQVAVSGITGKDLINLEIPRPSITEQKMIAEILSRLDDKMESNCIINATLEFISHAIFKSWFIDFDPVRAKAEGRKPFGMDDETAALFPDSFEDSELGEIPKGWRIDRIENCCDTWLGGTPSTSVEEYWYPAEINWINSSEMNNDRIIKASKMISKKGLENSATKLLPRRTVVIAITGATMGKMSLLEIESCANQSVVGVKSRIHLSQEFLYLFLKSSMSRLLEASTGSAQQHINKNDLDDFRILIPSVEVSKLFEKTIFPLFDLQHTNLLANDDVSSIRDALLPKLLSGEIRIPASEEMEKVDA